MKKILIVVWYFPPANSIASVRPASWAKEFRKYGFDITILTRHWKGTENQWVDFLKEYDREINVEITDTCKIIRVPYKQRGALKILNTRFFKKKIISKITYALLPLFGYLSAGGGDAYFSFKKYVDEHLAENNYDGILVSALPSNIIRLGSYFSRKYNIPLIADFRDVWGRWRSRKNYRRSAREKYLDYCHFTYLKKWLKRAVLVTSTSEGFLANYIKIYNGRACVITNGYEKDLFSEVPVLPEKKFTFSVIGTLYPQQDIDLMIKGLNLFLQDKDPSTVQLNFIGVSAIKDVADKLKDALPDSNLNLTKRVTRDDALRYMKNADVLHYPAWKEYTGIYSGKIFEYIASGVNVLIAPGDADVIDSLIKETQAGCVVNSPQTFCDTLNQFYEEKNQSGKIGYQGKKDKIMFYTRENQAKLMAEEINAVLNDSNYENSSFN